MLGLHNAHFCAFRPRHELSIFEQNGQASLEMLGLA